MLQQTLEPIFGATGALFVQFFLVLIVVLALMALVIWLVRFLSGGRFGVGFNRQRAPRLGLVDALPIDQKRRLILVRRDQFEHLILIGGPTDVVVEQTIFRGVPLNARLRPEPVRMPGSSPAPAPAAGLPVQAAPTGPAAASERIAALRERVRPVPGIDGEDLPSPRSRDQADDADAVVRPSLAPSFRQRNRSDTGGATGAISSERSPAAERPTARNAIGSAYPADDYPPPGVARLTEDETLSVDMAAHAPGPRRDAAPTDPGGIKSDSPSLSPEIHDQNGATDRVANLEQEMARMLAEISGKPPA